VIGTVSQSVGQAAATRTDDRQWFERLAGSAPIPRKKSVEDRLAKEAAVIPLVQAAGVPTSGVVAYDASRTTADVPYIVLERLRGQTLADVGYDPETGARAHRSLGVWLLAVGGGSLWVLGGGFRSARGVTPPGRNDSHETTSTTYCRGT